MMAQASERARRGLDHFVMRAAQATLAANPSSCRISPIEDDAQGTNVVMLTISSYSFRVLMFLHFEGADATRAHFAALSRKSVSEMTPEKFNDLMMERGNLLCGAINRELGKYFPHIGMSTASLLGQQVTAHLRSVQAKYLRRFRAVVAADVTLHVTVAVCMYRDLDFAFETGMTETVASEIEMF